MYQKAAGAESAAAGAERANWPSVGSLQQNHDSLNRGGLARLAGKDTNGARAGAPAAISARRWMASNVTAALSWPSAAVAARAATSRWSASIPGSG